MHLRSLLRLLLTPSITSGLAIFIIATIILGYSGWLYISDNQIFYDYLFGAYGLKTFVWQNSLGFTVWTQAFMSSPVAYYLLVAGVAVTVGLAVFTVLQMAGVFVRSTTVLIDQAQFKGAVHRAAMREQLSRLGLRVTALASWVIYGAFFVSSFLPFTIVLNQLGIRMLRDGTVFGAAVSLGALLLLLLSLHLHSVFLRLTALRPRIYSGDAAIAEIEADEHPRMLNVDPSHDQPPKSLSHL